MAKRFTDTDKWKNPFIKSIPIKYKLLWFYILDDCDIAGLWRVDIEIACIRCGQKFDVAKALEIFKEKIIVIDNGNKWFIPSFIEFQYGQQLSKTNNIFKSIDRVLSKYNLYQYLTVEISETGTTISSHRNRISQKIKDKIFLDAEFVCEYCQQQKLKTELVVDHFIPLSKNGDNSDDNLICCCIRCNSHKTDLMPDEFISRKHAFLNPSEKILNLLIKKLNRGFNAPLGAMDKDKDKDKDMDKDKEVIVNPELVRGENKNLTWNVSETVLANETEFNEICMSSYKNTTQVKHALTKYHLWLEKEAKYPVSRKQAFAGIKLWLMNEKKDSRSFSDVKEMQI